MNLEKREAVCVAASGMRHARHKPLVCVEDRVRISRGDTGSTAALCNSEREDRVSKLSACDAMNSLQLDIFAKFNFINKSDSFYCEPHKQACCISKKHRL